MKKGILFLALFTSITATAQKLKDALYSGKLKTDSGTVIRSGEDIRSKIDTARKTPEPVKPAVVKNDSSGKSGGNPAGVTTTTPTATTTPPATTAPAETTAAPVDNNKRWKEFSDAVISSLKSEVLPNKKIKKGDYMIMVDYAIETDGKITINNVYPTPENKFLEEQVRERFGIDTPQLSPVLGGGGKPRKVMKRFNFTLVKE